MPEPDASWRVVKFVVKHHDGAVVNIELLRSPAWIAAHGLLVGQLIEMRAPEMDLHATALVTSIEPGPQLAEREGSVVIGRFITQNIKMLARVEFEVGEALVGTLKHPIWSEDREEFIGLAQLQTGERVRSREGFAVVRSLTISPADEPVYNIEVHGEHVYEVTNAGILVHNNDLCARIEQLEALAKKADAAEDVELAKQYRRQIGELTNASGSAKSTFDLPKTWRSAKGVSGTFSDGKHTFRIDTHNLSPGERFHIHIYDGKGKEIAVVQGSGTNGIWRERHKGEVLKKPSEVSRELMTDIRRLLRNALNNIE